MDDILTISGVPVELQIPHQLHGSNLLKNGKVIFSRAFVFTTFCGAQFATFVPLGQAQSVNVLQTPTAFKASNGINIAYELKITNNTHAACTLTAVPVKSGGHELAVIQGEELKSDTKLLEGPSSSSNLLVPGASSAVYVWIRLSGRHHIPKRITHELRFAANDPCETADRAGTSRVNTKVPAIGFPLEGDRWVAVNGPSNTSYHRRMLFPQSGQTTVPMRYATDWMQLSEDGSATYRGNPKDNRSYFQYGANVIAVATGVVEEASDGMPENVPGTFPPRGRDSMASMAGNHIVLNLGKGVHALYAHLQTGSIGVQVGETVRAGQVIAKVGNSGNSIMPHLHFQLVSSGGLSGAAGDGIPYRLRRYCVSGHYKLSEDYASGIWTALPRAEEHTGDMPVQDEVVSFSRLACASAPRGIGIAK